MPAVIELEANRLRIRERVFDVFRTEPPDNDGRAYCMEATADEKNLYAPRRLKPFDLRGIPGAALPYSLSILIEFPPSQLRCAIHALFENLKKGPTVREIVYFDYDAWHMPMNLGDFAEVLKAEVAKSKDVVRRVHLELSDGSIYVHCEGPIGSEQDCYEAYRALDAVILRGCRAALRAYMRDKPHIDDKPQQAADDSRGIRWWIRYVFVPLGVPVFAFLGWLIGKFL